MHLQRKAEKINISTVVRILVERNKDLYNKKFYIHIPKYEDLYWCVTELRRLDAFDKINHFQEEASASSLLTFWTRNKHKTFIEVSINEVISETEVRKLSFDRVHVDTITTKYAYSDFYNKEGKLLGLADLIEIIESDSWEEH